MGKWKNIVNVCGDCQYYTYGSNIVKAIAASYFTNNIIVDTSMESNQKWICKYMISGWGD